MEKRIRELCQILLNTEDEAVFRAAADELRQALHQHIEELRDQTRQLGVADRILTPDLDALTPRQPGSTSKDSPPPEPTGLPTTIVLQIPPNKSKRKPRRTPPAA